MANSSNLPLFSVLCATRNCLPFVGQCLRSALSQDWSNWEMIVMDDCSTDRTYKRACEIASKSDHIQVLQNEKRMHCGLTYRKLLGMATGTYCGILDGDDVLEPNAISLLSYAVILRTPILISYGLSISGETLS